MNHSSIVTLENVHKSFGKNSIIKGINLEVTQGEVVTLLGVNGAGKTTTINMMLGIEHPTAGKILLNGGDPRIAKNRLNIGVTPQNTDFPQFITVLEILKFVSAHFPHAVAIEEITMQFDLKSILHKQTALLSGGQRRRLAVALAFIGKPKIVFLDEPTTGLDVQSRLQVWKSINEYIKAGGTLFLTTHYLEEAEALATRIVILQNGKIRMQGSVEKIKSIVSHTTVVFETDGELPELNYAQKTQKENNRYHVVTNDADALIREIVQKNILFKNLTIERGTLETAFLALANEKVA